MPGFEIVDAHQHVGSLESALPYSSVSKASEIRESDDADRRVAVMDSTGIDWAVLQPGHGYSQADGLQSTMAVNDRMAFFKRYRPERFKAVVGTVEPRHGDAVLPEIFRCKHELSLDGLSWHHRFQGCYLDCPIMWRILETMEALELTPMMHVNAESSLEAPWRLQRLARDFPALTFIAFDAFWSSERSRQVLDAAAATPNIVWDCGGTVCYLNVTEWVRQNGSESLCFSAAVSYSGSSAGQSIALDRIAGADIDDDDRRRILGLNVRRAFRLRMPAPPDSGEGGTANSR